MTKSRQQLDNAWRKVYQKASEKLDKIELTLPEIENLLDKQRTESKSSANADKNPKSIHGTYLDKQDQSCPFNLCGGTRGVQMGPKTSTMCPCVRPDKLREYQNTQPKSISG